jgi:hypothetical protein
MNGLDMKIKLLKLSNSSLIMCCCMEIRNSRKWGGLFM